MSTKNLGEWGINGKLSLNETYLTKNGPIRDRCFHCGNEIGPYDLMVAANDKIGVLCIPCLWQHAGGSYASF